MIVISSVILTVVFGYVVARSFDAGELPSRVQQCRENCLQKVYIKLIKSNRAPFVQKKKKKLMSSLVYCGMRSRDSKK